MKRKPKVYKKIRNLASFRCYPKLKKTIDESRKCFSKEFCENIMEKALKKEIDKLME